MGPQGIHDMFDVSEIEIKKEDASLIQRIWEINRTAFRRRNEADLVDILRKHGAAAISLVAEVHEKVVGHILFSPVTIEGEEHTWTALGLAPMSVLPDYQRMGIGKRLVTAGLEECKRQGYDIVVVVGHAEYYPAFGFVPARTYEIRCEFNVSDEAFMIKELRPGALKGIHGVVRYRREFADV